MTASCAADVHDILSFINETSQLADRAWACFGGLVGRRDWHDALHGARTDHGRPHRRARRHLRARRAVVRDADGTDPVVARALQRRPEDRYDTVDQMSAEFRQALDKIERRSPAPPAAAPRVTRMVVLPFRVPTDAPDLLPLMDGIPEALTALLAQSPARQLVSNRLGQPYGETTDLVAAGKALD